MEHIDIVLFLFLVDSPVPQTSRSRRNSIRSDRRRLSSVSSNEASSDENHGRHRRNSRLTRSYSIDSRRRSPSIRSRHHRSSDESRPDSASSRISKRSRGRRYSADSTINPPPPVSRSRRASVASRRSRKASTESEKSRKSQSPTPSKSAFERVDTPRFADGWGFGGKGSDSAKSRISKKSTRSNYRRKIESASESEDHDKSEDSEHEPVSRAPSSKSKVASADRFSRRMSYVPPRMRKNSVKKSAAQTKEKLDKAGSGNSALSRKSIKNFDDKKFHSNSHLTPVDW